MDNTRMFYIAGDGDSIGNIVAQSFLKEDIEGVKNTAKKIEIGGHIARTFILKCRGNPINIGGDEFIGLIPESAIPDLERLRSDYSQATGFTLSIGVGKLPSEAAKSLLVAKIRGKNQVVLYDSSIKKEIKMAKAKVKKHRATNTEQKLAEAGMFKSEEPMTEYNCPYCKQTDGVDPSHCKSCHDLDPACPFCAEANSKDHDCTNDSNCPFCQEQHDPMSDSHPEDCPFCQEGNVQNSNTPIKLPTTTSSQDYDGQDLIAPDIGKPDAISDSPDGLGVSFDTPTNENIKIQDQQGIGTNLPTYEKKGESTTTQNADPESIQAVLDVVDGLPPTESQARMEANDDQAPNMIDGVLRPDDYNSNDPGDMGLQDDPGPEMTDVLQEGLDNHIDGIQRERVMQMVGEALSGFKNSKDILEKAKMQAPQLYQASISMLKAMIEMAKLLGLEGGANSTPEYEQHPDNNLPSLDGSSPTGSTPNYEPSVKKEGEPVQADPKLKG